MDERVMQFRVGVMFLAALIVAAILLVMFGKLPNLIPGRYYTLQVRFDHAPGVTENTPVRKSGILIGRVQKVELVDQDSKVLVTLRIDSDKTIYQDEHCYIARDLLGDTALVFAPDPTKTPKSQEPVDSTTEPFKMSSLQKRTAPPRERVAPGTVLEGRVSDDPTGLKRALAEPIDTVSNTGRALTAASAQLAAAAKRVEDILDPETQKNAQDVLRDSAASLRSIRSILGDEENRHKLSEAMNRLPDTLTNMNNTFQSTSETLNQFTQRTGPDQKTSIERMVAAIEMTERTLRRFNESPEPGRPAPADQIAAAMENIGEITGLMRTIMARIEQGDGSLGALLKDRQLYDRLNRAARNVEEVSRQLKPIADDARVFMDKAARHPGVILRDAVKPGVGIK